MSGDGACNPATASDIGGKIGNLTLGEGTIIENAVGDNGRNWQRGRGKMPARIGVLSKSVSGPVDAQDKALVAQTIMEGARILAFRDWDEPDGLARQLPELACGGGQ